MTRTDLRRIILERARPYGAKCSPTVGDTLRRMADGIGVAEGTARRWYYGERGISDFQAARIAAWAGSMPIPTNWQLEYEAFESAVRRMCRECDSTGVCTMADCPLRAVTSHRKVRAA